MNSTNIQSTEKKTAPAETKPRKTNTTSKTINPARKAAPQKKKYTVMDALASGAPMHMEKSVVTLLNGSKVDGFRISFDTKAVKMMSLNEIFENEARLKLEREQRK